MYDTAVLRTRLVTPSNWQVDERSRFEKVADYDDATIRQLDAGAPGPGIGQGAAGYQLHVATGERDPVDGAIVETTLMAGAGSYQMGDVFIVSGFVEDATPGNWHQEEWQMYRRDKGDGDDE